MRKGLSWMTGITLLLAGCAPGDHPAESHPAQDRPPRGDGVEITGAWSRAVPAQAPVAAGYMTIRNHGQAEDRLLAVRSDAAGHVEIHEVRTEDGIARMRELEGGLALPAGSTVEFRPGGYHLMFMAPGEGFAAGGHVAATLEFEKAGERVVDFEVHAGGAAQHGSDEQVHH